MEGEGECTRPTVYMCGQCRLPLGDTDDRVGSHPEDTIVLLKAVTMHVNIDMDKQLSSFPNEVGSVLCKLHCEGCNSVVGRFYTATPRHLDYKRDLFSLAVSATKSYTFGIADKQVVNDCEEPKTLNTFETLQQQIKKFTIYVDYNWFNLPEAWRAMRGDTVH
ncbi:protein Mis18-alpha-like isoform X2 [Pseudophryne corroboree]|uniref:protein Mis18-alpha-like isoform X2 n=1 Tax=Pseudophryne corroboree TaxID=495146 RepID=UPI0030818C50